MEFETNLLEYQTYTISRDLSSWIASIGLNIENNGNGGTKTYGVLLSFTLKDLPSVRLPFTLDPNSVADLSQNQNK